MLATPMQCCQFIDFWEVSWFERRAHQACAIPIFHPFPVLSILDWTKPEMTSTYLNQLLLYRGVFYLSGFLVRGFPLVSMYWHTILLMHGHLLILLSSVVIAWSSSWCMISWLHVIAPVGCMSSCWLHEFLLVARAPVGCMSSWWLHEFLLVARAPVGCMSSCWLHEFLLVARAPVGCMSSCWLH